MREAQSLPENLPCNLPVWPQFSPYSTVISLPSKLDFFLSSFKWTFSHSRHTLLNWSCLFQIMPSWSLIHYLFNFSNEFWTDTENFFLTLLASIYRVNTPISTDMPSNIFKGHQYHWWFPFHEPFSERAANHF